MVDKPRILFYDLETSPLKAWVWGCGEQYIRHGQLDKQFRMWGIICVTYCWNDGEPAKHIDWGYNKQDTGKVIRQFDKIISKADHIIGKNNKNFDDKMLNALRMINKEEPMPRWAIGNDDLQVQMKRHLRLPSHALDYISESLGYGGKIKMEMQDWIEIVERGPRGKECFNKMIGYGKKDVEDTRGLWYRMYDYIDPKFKINVFNDSPMSCIQCASENVKKNGSRMSGGTKYQNYYCNDCGRYAGMRVYGSEKARLR